MRIVKVERKRLDYLDIARGIGIFLVVLGHSITVGMAEKSEALGALRLYIYIIHMPLFFIISGILFEKNKEKYALSSPVSYCGHKAAVFMIPYLIFSLLNYAIIYISAAIPFLGGVLSANGYHAVPLHETVLAIITFIGHQDNHLWFIYVMFFVLVINRVLLFKQTKLTYILLFILYFVSLILPGNTPILLTNTLQYLFLFSVGRFLYASGLLTISPNRILACAAAHIASIIIIVLVPSQTLGLIHGFLILVIKCTAAYILLEISMKLAAFKAAASLKKLGYGTTSYIIYLVHMPFMTSGIVFLLQRTGIPDIGVILASTAVTLILCGIICKIFFICRRTARKIYSMVFR